MTVEEWRWVPGYEGRYEVSDTGSVRSYCTPFGVPTSVFHPMLQRTWHGYRYVDLCGADGDRHGMRVHRAVLLAFVGPCPGGCQSRHHDNDRANNRLDNLSWDTIKRNETDRRFNGTRCTGERHGESKLTDDIVWEIRSNPSIGCSELGRVLGVDRTVVWKVRHWRSWRHVEGILG